MNNFTAIVNLGADPESLTLGSNEVYKLRCADKGVGKKAITHWITVLVGGPDKTTAARLAKGDSIMVTGTLVRTEYAPKKPRYKSEMIESSEMPFAKILQVVKSPTFFNQSVGDFPTDDVPAPTDADVPPDLTSSPDLDGL
jgi:single-stranded DNA-binding protein